MVIDESPSSLSSLAVMQMDVDLPVHLNVYISVFKQWCMACQALQYIACGNICVVYRNNYRLKYIFMN